MLFEKLSMRIITVINKIDTVIIYKKTNYFNMGVSFGRLVYTLNNL